MDKQNPDVKRAYDALKKKAAPYKEMMDYYEGNQPLKYSSERLREAFENCTAKFVQNWCAVVVDSALDRLVFKGWDVSRDEANKRIDAFFQENNIDEIAGDIHKDALITDEGFVIFDKIDNATVPFRNDPRLVHVFYDKLNPRKKQLAAKWWVDEKKTYLNLYYEDKIEKYVSNKEPESEKAFAFLEEIDNPFNKIPVVHFRSGQPQLVNLITIQDAVNKTFSDMMVVGEFNTFQQRYVVTNANIDNLKNNPRTTWQIPKGDSTEENTQAGTFDPADMGQFLTTIDKLANSIAIISRTPKHYFVEVGGNISGDALIAMEAPLVKKVTNIKKKLNHGWIEVAQFILEGIPSTDITTSWDPVETVQPIAQAQRIQYLSAAGLPLTTILRREGWTESEIQQMLDDAKEEKANQSSLADAVLESVRNKTASNNV